MTPNGLLVIFFIYERKNPAHGRVLFTLDSINIMQ